MTLLQQKAVFALLSIVVVVSLIMAAVPLTRHWAGATGDQVASPAGARTASPTQGRTDLTPILALAPFGAPAAPPDAAPQETSLNLKLLGVLIADPPSNSTAIIAATDGAPHAYRVEDDVASGVTLKAVYADSVVLNVSGQDETLAFTKEAAASSGVAAIRATIAASEGGTLENPSANPADEADAVVDNYRKRIAEDPKAVLKDVGMTATAKGYRLTASMNADLRRVGFRQDDLIVRVNGNAVGDPDLDKKLFDQIVASGRMRVEVMRNGNLVVMTIPLRGKE